MAWMIVSLLLFALLVVESLVLRVFMLRSLQQQAALSDIDTSIVALSDYCVTLKDRPLLSNASEALEFHRLVRNVASTFRRHVRVEEVSDG